MRYIKTITRVFEAQSVTSSPWRSYLPLAVKRCSAHVCSRGFCVFVLSLWMSVCLFDESYIDICGDRRGMQLGSGMVRQRDTGGTSCLVLLYCSKVVSIGVAIVVFHYIRPLLSSLHAFLCISRVSPTTAPSNNTRQNPSRIPAFSSSFNLFSFKECHHSFAGSLVVSGAPPTICPLVHSSHGLGLRM